MEPYFHGTATAASLGDENYALISLTLKGFFVSSQTKTLL